MNHISYAHGHHHDAGAPNLKAVLRPSWVHLHPAHRTVLNISARKWAWTDEHVWRVALHA
jgi:hypothetical protein